MVACIVLTFAVAAAAVHLQVLQHAHAALATNVTPKVELLLHRLMMILLLLLLLLLFTCRYSSGLMLPVRKSVVSAPLLGASVVCSNLPGSALFMGCACNTDAKRQASEFAERAVYIGATAVHG
jgi:hypothetical protein